MGSRIQSVSGVTQNIIMKKYTLIMFALMAVTACVVGSPQRKKISVKAPSPFENYGCQCANYTWQDTYGKIQGNCKSSDTTRGRWCYVRSGNSCNDIQYSKNRRDSYGRLRQWSYEACATPAPGYGGGYRPVYNNNRPVYNSNRPNYNNNRPVVQINAQASVNTRPITRPITSTINN